MNPSVFHHVLSAFISERYPYTKSHPIENPDLLKSWGLDPKIYRPLPRQTFHEELGIAEIKGPFQDLQLLKKHLIDSAVLSLYTHAPPRRSIILFTWVYWDGWGDYYAQLDCAKLLRERLGDHEITLVTCLRKTQPPTETLPNQHFVFFEKGSKPQFPPFLLKKMQASHLLFQFPTYYPHTDALMEELGPQLKYEFLGESGFIDTPDYHPQCGRRCMGLHFLEKGVLIKSVPPKKKGPPYYFAYTRSAEGLYHYIQALISWKQTDLSLCVFKIEHVLNVVKQEIPGVKQAEIFIDHTVTTVPLAETGILLRFDVKQKVSHRVFLTLLNESEDFVACTGDGSLFEAISCGKIFYYDTPQHKKNFLEDLVALATTRTPQALPFFKNPAAVQDIAVRKALFELTAIIQREHAVNETLCQIIRRALCHQAVPELEQHEQRILTSFSKGEIDAPEALNAIHKTLNLLIPKA